MIIFCVVAFPLSPRSPHHTFLFFDMIMPTLLCLCTEGWKSRLAVQGPHKNYTDISLDRIANRKGWLGPEPQQGCALPRYWFSLSSLCCFFYLWHRQDERIRWDPFDESWDAVRDVECHRTKTLEIRSQLCRWATMYQSISDSSSDYIMQVEAFWGTLLQCL